MQKNLAVTKFSMANAQFRANDYIAAMILYDEIIEEDQEIAKHALINKGIAVRKIERKNKFGDCFNVVPIEGIQHGHVEDRSWISTSPDPQFEISFGENQDRTPGWYQLSLVIKTKEKSNIAKLYPDFGHGYSEDTSIEIPFESGRISRRFIKFANVFRSLRFDPKEGGGPFQLTFLDWEKVGEEKIAEKMLFEISRKNGGISDVAQDALRQNLLESSATLKTDYLEFLEKKYKSLFTPSAGKVNYEDWIEKVESPSLPHAEEAQAMIESFIAKPLISVIVPTFNTEERWLRACIDSVLAQSYQNWELCIADDASSKPHVRKVLKEYADRHSKIKVIIRKNNGHISEASNSALTLATGGYVALLDHDDMLANNALLYIVQAINRHPESLIIYSDEDKITPDGRRFDPHFKSDWNPDLFFAQNYVSHLGVYQRELVERVGGFREGLEGSQDYDLLLRCLKYVTEKQIVHIPKILYHWRILEGSTALSSGEKSYTTEAGIKALKNYFDNGATKVCVDKGMLPNTYKVRWPVPDPVPFVSLLIPTRDRCNLVEVAVRSILTKSNYTNYEILILDNGSIESDALAFFERIQKEDGRVKVLRYDFPFNFSAINNFGARHAKGEIIGLINNDIEVINADWLTELVSHACRSEIGCVGAKLYYSNETIQHGGVILGIGGVAGHSHKYFPRGHFGYFSRLTLTQSLSAVTAACLLVRKSIFEEVGGLDERLSVAFNDVDFCMKVTAAGYRNIWTPHAELYHYESVSRGPEDSPEKVKRFQMEVELMKSRWGEFLKNDPYYNINLTKISEDFSIGLI